MSLLIAEPDVLATTAANLADLGSSLVAANGAGAGPTTALEAVAKDDVAHVFDDVRRFFDGVCRDVVGRVDGIFGIRRLFEGF